MLHDWSYVLMEYIQSNIKVSKSPLYIIVSRKSVLKTLKKVIAMDLLAVDLI
jgi:hypothetical protein